MERSSAAEWRHAGPAAVTAVAIFLAPAALADFPDRPLRMLVGYVPGGGVDTTARALAQKLSVSLGQQVIVDNRSGASGNIATGIAARSAADGYTLLMGTIAPLAINPTLYGNLPFDPQKDLAPVSQVVNASNVLVVHPSVQATTTAELIALAKGRAGGLNYGSSGIGGTGHLAGVLFETLSGARMTHVPYNSAQAIIGVISGQVQLLFATLPSAMPQAKAGKLRALAVTTLQRAASAPELPTIAESGLPGFDANNWYGLLVPARTPRAVVAKLNAETIKALTSADLKARYDTLGLDAAPSTPEAFGAYIRSEITKWAKVIKASGAKAE